MPTQHTGPPPPLTSLGLSGVALFQERIVNSVLVLTRKLNEEIIVTTAEGKELTLKVVDIDRGKVRLAFVADTSIKIMRSELLERSK
jgi:carbon storage regulator CsrA